MAVFGRQLSGCESVVQTISSPGDGQSTCDYGLDFPREMDGAWIFPTHKLVSLRQVSQPCAEEWDPRACP